MAGGKKWLADRMAAADAATRKAEDKQIAAAAKLDPSDKSEWAEGLRDAAASFKAHRAARNG